MGSLCSSCGLAATLGSLQGKVKCLVKGEIVAGQGVGGCLYFYPLVVDGDRPLSPEEHLILWKSKISHTK